MPGRQIPLKNPTLRKRSRPSRCGLTSARSRSTVFGASALGWSSSSVPAPGLTLVVGRNGSGKSSFADALELLLTGDNQRWSARRAKIWKDGGRNLHTPDKAEIGRGSSSTVSKVPSRSGDPAKGRTSSKKEKRFPISEWGTLGCEEPIATYRPFLSYNELGSMLEEGPSKLYDALTSILGLEDLVQAGEALAEARKNRNEKHKATVRKLADIRPRSAQ